MKYGKYIFLLSAGALFFVGLYFWLAQWKMDYAAFFMSLSAIG
jgi:hypothetical protein